MEKVKCESCGRVVIASTIKEGQCWSCTIEGEGKTPGAVSASISKEEYVVENSSQSVYVKGFRMPFGEMVVFMVMWSLASIPAFIILAIIGAIFFAIFGALFF